MSVTLKNMQDETVELEVKYAMQSGAIRAATNDGDTLDEEVPVDASMPTLQKCIEFMKYYDETPMGDIAKPLRSDSMAELVGEWYANFIDVPQELLFDLSITSNRLMIRPLFDLASAKIASQLKNMDVEQMRKYFHTTGDFTPEEEEIIKKENLTAASAFWF